MWWMTLLGLSAPWAWSAGQVVDEQRVMRFSSLVGDMRSVWKQTQPPAKGMSREALGEAETRIRAVRHAEMGGLDLSGFLLARVTAIRGNPEMARREFLSAFSAPLAVDCVFGLMELVRDSPDGRNLHEDCLASLLPMSRWRSMMDHRRWQVFIPLVHPERPEVPYCDRDKLATIPRLLDEGGMDQEACFAFAEVVYGGYIPPWSTGFVRDTWYCPEAAEYWFRAAESARKAGREDLAGAFLMKAAVFGTEDLFRRCVDARRRWSTPVASRPSAKLSDEERERKRDALLKSVQFYVDMNAHPRAWALIDENREVFDKPDELRKEVQAKWLGVVSRTSGAAIKIYLYGYEVYPKGDPLRIEIPWALSDEAVAEVRKRLEQVKPEGGP